MSFLYSIGTFLFFTASVILTTWWFTRRTDNRQANTFFLADRRLSWIQVAGSLLLTNLSTEQLVGLNGAAAVHGTVVMAWEIVPVFALIALAWWFLPRYWSGNFTTVPEFLENRFDRTTRRLMGVIFLVTIAFNVLPFLLYSGGIVLSNILRLPAISGLTEQQSLLLIAGVIGICGTAFVNVGGMKAVAVADLIYGIGLLLAGLLIPLLALRLLGDGNAADGVGRLVQTQGPKLNPIGDAASNIPFETLFTGLLLINLFYWCTNQTIVQRTFGASSLAEGQKGILVTAALKLIGPLYLVVPGIIAAQLFGAAIGNGDFAYAKLLDVVLPTWLGGVFAAVLFGSIISSYNGAMHSAITVFCLDLYRPWLCPSADDQDMLRAGKRFALLICLLGILTSGFLHDSPAGVFTLMKRVMSAFKLPLLAVVVMGILSNRVPAWAAKAVLVGGIGTQFLLEWLLGHGIFGVTLHWLHVAGLNVVLLAAGMAIVARFSRSPVSRPESGAQRPSPRWRHLPLVSVILMIAAVGVYLALWQISRV